ncbi:uncharacterized protein LOC128712764 [Anopheles marshallii]|uniref:uncharacterized protein LOC128712764 n=1 Tax=Anopheles marshallii TaxID=1521116 RepID=UPI00237A818F|nr:uncharacterized protein LOC128712764 [Anopheles marshallii]
MLLLAFRSFFFIAVILGYSTGIWRLINDYFRREFQSYLEVESQTNKYLLQDPPKSAPDRNPRAGPPEAPDNQLPAPNVEQLFGDVKHRPDHQQVTDSIMVLFETLPSSATAEPVPDAKVYANGQEAETHRPGEMAVVVAAEVTDIRPQDEGHVRTMEPTEGERDGGEEEKWISYWSKRGMDRKRDGPDDDSNANAYCTISGETFAGAVTRIAQRIAADGDGVGCV